MKIRFRTVLKAIFLTIIALVIGLEILYQVIKRGEKGSPETVTLIFGMHQNPDIYMRSYGREPPQCAIWLEDSSGFTFQTVYVTRKAGTGNWQGITENPVALPFWQSRLGEKENPAGDPEEGTNKLDAVTGATPKFWRAVRRVLPFMGG